MDEAFIIMQFGDPQLDQIHDQVFRPAITACDLDPKRVDKHNQGGLLKSEIDTFIQKAKIIVADLTNERPNCYIEIGYAMGLGKFTNVILTARQDHNPTHPSYHQGGPRVHFDLAGYDILFWDPANFASFRQELETRLKRRLDQLKQKQQAGAPTMDDDDPLVTVSHSGWTLIGNSVGMNLIFTNTGKREAIDVKGFFNGTEMVQCGTIGSSPVERRSVRLGSAPHFNQPEFSLTYVDRKRHNYRVIQRGYLHSTTGPWVPYSKPSVIEKDGIQVWP
jgi:hypothetical protein